MPDSLLLDVFDPATCEQIVAELRASHGSAATVYGRHATGAVESSVRKATRLAAPPATRALVMRRIRDRIGELEAHFGVSLGELEEPQFLRYETGDYFVAHQDGNVPLLRDDSRFRRISVVLFLNDGYTGGALTFHGRGAERSPVTVSPGTLVAFRSETTHEVTPVTAGERYTAVSWFRVGQTPTN